jgi:flavin-dependent dehydrogenase
LDIPGLDYGAMIPKGDYVTVCLLSSRGDLHPKAMDTFLNHPAVKSVLPADFPLERFTCSCGPRINVMGSTQPFGDRIVFIGDCGVSRLYKDGIGAAYRSAKAAARTAIFQGISANDFRRYYLPFCRKMEFDNRIDNCFSIIGQIKKMRFARRAVLRMVSREQDGSAASIPGMSMVM